MKINLKNKWLAICLLVLGVSAISACYRTTVDVSRAPDQDTQMQPMTTQQIQTKCHQDCKGESSPTRCYNDCVRYHKDMMKQMKRDGNPSDAVQTETQVKKTTRTRSSSSY